MGAFASVTYTWNEEHTAAAYVARGSFIPTNNVIAGIKVHSGTTYLTVPRWRPGIPATLATLEASPAGEGSNVALLAPYPSWDMNTVGDCSRLQYVQSMEIVGDEMWVLDVGRINIFADDPSLISNKCPPKLVILSLRTTKGSGNPAAALLTYNFPDSVASHTASFLNDLVVDPARGIAYISDSGTGAIIAFSRDDLSSRRFADSTTLRNPAYEMVINGITYGTNKITTPVDGIALLPDGSRVVYCVVQGVQLWSVDARILADTSMGITQVQATQIYHGNKPSPSDGIAFDCTGTLYFGGLTTNSLYAWPFTTLATANVSTAAVVVQSTELLSWIDTFAFDDSNGLYLTSNHLDRYISGTMDFSGNSGPNIHILRFNIGAQSYQAGSCMGSAGVVLSPPPPPVIRVASTESMETKLETSVVLLSIILVLLVMVALALAVKQRSLTMQLPTERLPLQQSHGAVVDAGSVELQQTDTLAAATQELTSKLKDATGQFARLKAELEVVPPLVPPSKHVLIVLTSNDKFPDGQLTGWYLPEAVHPYYKFVEAGFQVSFCSVAGKATIDPKSMPGDEAGQRFMASPALMKQCREAPAIGSFDISGFDAIFFAAGFGVMWDFPDNPNIQKVVREMYEAGKLIGAVCHGPIAISDVKLSNGQYMIKDKECAGFTNEEESAQPFEEMVRNQGPGTVEDRLKAVGAKYKSVQKWQPFVVVDGTICTGQNPKSAGPLAERMVEMLSRPFRPPTAFYQHILFTVPSDKVADLTELAEELVAKSDAEPGCIRFTISADAKSPGQYFLYEEWTSDAALEAHKAMPHFKALFSDRLAKYWSFISMQKGVPL